MKITDAAYEGFRLGEKVTVDRANERLNNLQVTIESLKGENELLTLSRDNFRDAYNKMRNGRHVEIRMPGGELDEIVGYGGFHVEQMDTNEWFFDLGGCAFFVRGKKVKLSARDYDNWGEAKGALACALNRPKSEPHTSDQS